MKSANHLNVRTEYTPTNEKERTDESALQDQPKINKQHFTATNPLQGWFDLAKPSRNRQQKRTWKRGNQRGRRIAYLVAHLALIIVLAALIVGGLANA